MVTEENFRGKRMLLRAPDDASEVIRCSRCLPIVSKFASNVSLLLSDANGLAELIQTSFPDITVLSTKTSTPSQPDIELDLTQLPNLFVHDLHLIPIPYLHPPEENWVKFHNLMGVKGKLNIGLAFYGTSDNPLMDITTISNNITLNQRHKSNFFFIPANPNQSASKPPFSSFQDTTEWVHNYSDLASLLMLLDIIVSFDNDVAHLAAALGKPVWLLTPHSGKTNRLHSWDAFPKVTVFRQPPSKDWGEVIQTIALFLLLQPESPSFKPFSTKDMILNQPATLPFPTLFFENTSQLTEVLNAALAVFTTVTIETTTACNRKCSYCPHSTDLRKPEAFMKEEIFYRIIDSLYEYAPSYSGTIIPCMYGEPLLDKRIESFIRYTKLKFPQARIEFITNGDFLSAERFISLQEAGVDHYNISQHTPKFPQTLSDILSTLQKKYTEKLPITIVKILEQNKFNRGGLVEVEGSPRSLLLKRRFAILPIRIYLLTIKGTHCCVVMTIRLNTLLVILLQKVLRRSGRVRFTDGYATG